jgi:hypothetical protein
MIEEEKIRDNMLRFKSIINTEFSGDRLKKILNMVECIEDRMAVAPASSKEYYHSAFVGGYLEHVLQVFDIAMELYDGIYAKYKNTDSFTREELVLSVLFHDLGKVGDANNEFYIFQTNKWRRDTLKELYMPNPNIPNMDTADRSLYLLQYFDITLTQNEWITIKIHDGMYSEANAKYFSVYNEDQVLKTMLPYIVHVADLLSSRFEYDKWASPKNKNEFVDKDDDFIPTNKIKSKKTLSGVLEGGTFDMTNMFES